jgi:hypothetical protein
MRITPSQLAEGVGPTFADSPVLREYFEGIDARPTVKAALSVEGLS